MLRCSHHRFVARLSLEHVAVGAEDALVAGVLDNNSHVEGVTKTVCNGLLGLIIRLYIKHCPCSGFRVLLKHTPAALG